MAWTEASQLIVECSFHTVLTGCFIWGVAHLTSCLNKTKFELLLEVMLFQEFQLSVDVICIYIISFFNAKGMYCRLTWWLKQVHYCRLQHK